MIIEEINSKTKHIAANAYHFYLNFSIDFQDYLLFTSIFYFHCVNRMPIRCFPSLQIPVTSSNHKSTIRYSLLFL